MTESSEDTSIAERVAAIAELPLEERAGGYEQLLAELQSTLEAADAPG